MFYLLSCYYLNFCDVYLVEQRVRLVWWTGCWGLITRLFWSTFASRWSLQISFFSSDQTESTTRSDWSTVSVVYSWMMAIMTFTVPKDRTICIDPKTLNSASVQQEYKGTHIKICKSPFKSWPYGVFNLRKNILSYGKKSYVSQVHFCTELIVDSNTK